MCLNLKLLARRKIAKEDIIVYKAVVRGSWSLDTPIWLTSWMRIEIPKDGILIPLEGNEHIPIHYCRLFPVDFRRWITQGAIHCYANNDNIDSHYYFKGIIPKGTEYYVSSDKTQYAAMRVILDMNSLTTQF